MKKAAALLCAFIMTVTVAACAKQPAPGQSSGTGSGESMAASSQAASSQANSAAASSGAASNTVSSASAAPVIQPAKIVSAKVTENKNKNDYQIKDTNYSYNKDNMTYKASYPQLSGKIANLQKANDAFKKCALQTINSLGTAKKAQKTTVKVAGDVTFEGKNFISVGFNEYTKLSPKAETTHVFRTVNVNLKTGVSVGLKDMIVKSDAFYKALEKAAKEQLDADLSSAVTASVIKTQMDSNAIFFTDTSVGFSVPVTKPEKRIIRITLTYQDVKPFITKNENWSNFI